MGRLQGRFVGGMVGILITAWATSPPMALAQGAPRPAATGPSTAAAEVAALAARLRRPDLPDAALVLRLAETVSGYVDLGQIFGPRHPTLQAAHARVAFLRRAVERSPSAGPHSRRDLSRGLQRRTQEIAAERLRLGLHYFARHPRMVAITQRLRTYQQLLLALGSPGGAATGSVPVAALDQLLVERAALRRTPGCP